MINPQWRGASLCTSCFAMLVEGLALDIVFYSGQYYDSWLRLSWNATLVLGCAQQALLMEILSHLFTADSCLFEAFQRKGLMHDRRTTNVF